MRLFLPLALLALAACSARPTAPPASPTPSPSPTPLAAIDARIQVARKITQAFADSPLRNYGFRASIAGPRCDVLLVEFLEVNMLPEMVRALHEGAVLYGRALPGGVGGQARPDLFRGLVYRNAGPGADGKTWTYGQVQRREVAALKVCGP